VFLWVELDRQIYNTIPIAHPDVDKYSLTGNIKEENSFHLVANMHNEKVKRKLDY